MGIYASTKTMFQIEQSAIGREIGALGRRFDETPTGRQQDSRDEDWVLWHEYSRRRWEEIEKPGCWFKLCGVVSEALHAGLPLYMSSEMYTVSWTPDQVRAAAIVLRKYEAAHPPSRIEHRYAKKQQRWLPVMTKGGSYVNDRHENDRLLTVAGMLDAAAARGDEVYFG